MCCANDEAAQPIALLTLVRHAESIANAKRVLQGVCDAPLSPKGVMQLDKLRAAWSPETDSDWENSLDLPKPSLIVTSPIGRAKKTAAAIARGCGMQDLTEEDSTTFRTPPCEPPFVIRHNVVYIDSGLSERNFGRSECTKEKKAVPGFARLPQSELGRAETDREFYARVAKAGQKWLDWLREFAHRDQPQSKISEKKIDKEEVQQRKMTETAKMDGSEDEKEEKNGMKNEEHPTTDIKDQKIKRGLESVQHTNDTFLGNEGHATNNQALSSSTDVFPHLVLVSHGLWINAFLRTYLPSICHGAKSYYIRSNNTGMFTVGLYGELANTRLQLLRDNDTRHLGETLQPAPKRRAKIQQRTTLTSIWR